MRLVYSAAAVLVALFASSDADSTGVTAANALTEPDVSLVAGVTDGDAYEANTQRRLRESFDNDDSTLSLDREERLNYIFSSSMVLSPVDGAVAKSGFLSKTVDGVADKAAMYAQRLANFREKHKYMGKPLKWWSKVMKWLSERSLVNKVLKWVKSRKVEGTSIGDRVMTAIRKHKKPATEGAADDVAGQAVWTRLDETSGKSFDDATLHVTNALKTIDGDAQLVSVKSGVETLRDDLEKLKAIFNQKHVPKEDWTAVQVAYGKFDSLRIGIREHIKSVIGDLSKVSENAAAATLMNTFKELDTKLEKVKIQNFKGIAEVDDAVAVAVPTVKVPDKALSDGPL